MQQPKKMNLMQLTFIVAVNMMGSGIIMLPTNMAQVGLCVAGGVEAVDGEGLQAGELDSSAAQVKRNRGAAVVDGTISGHLRHARLA